MTFSDGDRVVVETSKGTECGIASGGNHNVPDSQIVQPLKKALRHANEADLKRVEENSKKQEKNQTAKTAPANKGKERTNNGRNQKNETFRTTPDLFFRNQADGKVRNEQQSGNRQSRPTWHTSLF